MSSLALGIVTDGRTPETITRSVQSIALHIGDVFDKVFIVDDSADEANAAWLDKEFPEATIIHHETRRGLGGAVVSAWTTFLESGCDFYWHHEDDFVITEPVNIFGMMNILRRNDMLAQLALKRNAVNEVEVAAGGMMQSNPDVFTDADGHVTTRYLFTFNPFLARREVIECALDASQAMLERDVTDRLLGAGYHFGYLGAIADEPRVEHIGNVRSQGYRW